MSWYTGCSSRPLPSATLPFPQRTRNLVSLTGAVAAEMVLISPFRVALQPGGISMLEHKYRVGQAVEFFPERGVEHTAKGRFKIVRLCSASAMRLIIGSSTRWMGTSGWSAKASSVPGNRRVRNADAGFDLAATAVTPPACRPCAIRRNKWLRNRCWSLGNTRGPFRRTLGGRCSKNDRLQSTSGLRRVLRRHARSLL